MSEPGSDATECRAARVLGRAPRPHVMGSAAARVVHRPDVTISVRFTAAEIAAVRARAEAAGVKPTAYIRRLALAGEQPPLDRSQLSHLVEALTRDLEDLRRATG